MHRIVLLRIFLAVVIAAATAGNSVGQQYTMKAGAALGKVDSREIGGDIRRMLNVYWETNYGLQFAKYRHVTFGLAYLGTGGKFSDRYVPLVFDYDYNVKARF